MSQYDDLFQQFLAQQQQADRTPTDYEIEAMQRLADEADRLTRWQTHVKEQHTTWKMHDQAHRDYCAELDQQQGTIYRQGSMSALDKAIAEAELRGWMQGFFGGERQ